MQMTNTYVAHVVPPQPEDEPLVSARTKPLPAGFPFLVDGDAGEVIEPVLRWLISEHLAHGRRNWVYNTAKAQCEDLQYFWKFLDQAGLRWDEVEESDLAHFRDAMQAIVSWKTQQLLADATIERRLYHTLRFYDWARDAGFYKGPEFRKREVRLRRRVDADALIHTRSGPRTVKRHDLLPTSRKGAPAPRPIGRVDLQRLLHALGPLPSMRGAEGDQVDLRPSRDRLAAELGHKCGLRIDEVAQLETHQFYDLIPPSWEDHQLDAIVRLWVTKTKGLNPRWALLPTWLLQEIDDYIKGERAKAVNLAAKRAAQAAKLGYKHKPWKLSNKLFVNSVDAGRFAGNDITTGTLHHKFHGAVLSAGLIKTTEKIDPETGDRSLVKKAKHSFHDLRHTFAIETYHSERLNGNSEPWKIVQARLGHKHLQTTFDYYLQVVAVEEAAISDRMAKRMRRHYEDS